MIALYPQFDHAVSVAPTLARRNEEDLRAIAPAQHVAARNVSGAAVVRRGATQPLAPLFDTPWARALDAGDGRDWFAVVGRLSPEKNHARLFRAFRRLLERRPDARLLVVGDGPLRTELEQQIVRDDLVGAVTMIGAVIDPSPILARVGCLVVSSDHEGQPMVVLEAAALGRTVVMTEFGSATDVLPIPGVHVVARTAQGLTDGMAAFLDGRLPAPRFDADRYDRDALAAFLDATMPATAVRPPEPSRASRPTAGDEADAGRRRIPATLPGPGEGGDGAELR
jgi:CDP-glycerol glycerophosphotransferase